MNPYRFKSRWKIIKVLLFVKKSEIIPLQPHRSYALCTVLLSIVKVHVSPLIHMSRLIHTRFRPRDRVTALILSGRKRTANKRVLKAESVLDR